MKKLKKENGRCKAIRKGDTVMAIRGNEKGQSGTVLSSGGDRVLVQGLNMRKKHVKKSELNPQGGVVEMERPIHVSNLRVCNEEGVPVKLHVRCNDEGQKELYYKQDGKEVLYRSMKKTEK